MNTCNKSQILAEITTELALLHKDKKNALTIAGMDAIANGNVELWIKELYDNISGLFISSGKKYKLKDD